MRNKEHSGAALSKRAATRLQKLLTDLGHPMDALGREASLARITSLSKRSVSNLLSGIVPWTLDDIGVLCATFGKSAGYFLDSVPGQAIPADSEVVTSMDGGESIVWRAPSGFLNRPRDFPGKALRYVSTSSIGYFDSTVRTLLVYEDWADVADPIPVVKNSHYMIEDADGVVQPMRCMDVTHSVGVFATKLSAFSDQIIVPIRMQSHNLTGIHLAGRPIGAIQGC